MKKKVITNTYLNEAEKYQIKLYLDEEDYYVSVKKLIHVTEKFIIWDNVIGMDDGYYIIEIIPKNENYALRVFLDDKKNVVEYYFDIIKESGIDKKYKVPYFMDLYLDIKVLYTKEYTILDEDELNDALKTNDITEEDYNLIIKTKDKLIEEITTNSNKLMNLDYSKYLRDM